MKRAFVIMIIFICAWSGLAVAQDNSNLSQRKRTPTVIVMPFRNTSTESKQSDLGNSISAMLNTHLRNETNFTVLDRDRLGKILDENNSPDQIISDEKRSQLQKIYSVEDRIPRL